MFDSGKRHEALRGCVTRDAQWSDDLGFNPFR